MNTTNLTDKTDEILRKVERNKEYPGYLEATFGIKCRNKPNRALNQSLCKPLGTDLLRALEWARTLADARLTQRQLRVFCARLKGYSWSEIGKFFGHTKQAALKLFKQALRKFKQTLRESKFRGLHQIYRSEVMRYSTTRMTH